MSIRSLPASYDNYIRVGFSLVPIPPGTKGPRHVGWNRRENALTSSAALPAGYGVGLAHAYSGTMALDIDDYDMAEEMLAQEGVHLRELLEAWDAVTIESGVSGHRKLLYKMPFGLTLPSKKINSYLSGKPVVAYELRCASADGFTVQDVIPPSIHPTTMQPYRWGGRGDWSNIPTIPPKLLEHWYSFIKDDAKPIKVEDRQDVNWSDIEKAMAYLSPDCDREQWVHIGMALHQAGTSVGNPDRGLEMWNEWSARSTTKYKGVSDLRTQWRSFKADGKIGVGTIFHYAKEAGYISDHHVDLMGMFQALPDPTSPKVLDGAVKPSPPDINLDLWPKDLVTRALEVSKTRGCDPLIPLFAGLAAVCGAADSQIRLELMHEFKVPPVLWIMTLGAPADKKTPGSAPMFDPLKDIELSDRDNYHAQLLMWEAREAAHNAARKEFYQTQSNPLEANDAPVIVDKLPPQPVPLRLLVEDITSQKLVRQCADRPRGLLCYMDEMAGWVNKVTDNRSGEDRSAWVRGYECSSYSYDRVTSGSIQCDHFAVSMYGNIQPKVFHKGVKAMATDGLLQRFIPVVIRSDMTKRNEPIPSFMSNKLAYQELINRVYTLPTRTYTLSPEAFESYREFQSWYDRLRCDEQLIGSDDTYMTAIGKTEGLAGRLALVFHLIENAYEQQVRKETMDRAILVMKDYIIPAFRYVYNTIHESSIDQWIIEYVIRASGERDTIGVHDIRRSARSVIARLEKSPTAAEYEIRSCLDWLCTQNWLVKTVNDRSGNHTYAVSPILSTMYAEYRKQVTDAKQRVMDQILEHVYKVSGNRHTRAVVGNRHPLRHVAA